MPVIQRAFWAMIVALFALLFAAPLPFELRGVGVAPLSALFHIGAYLALTLAAVTGKPSHAPVCIAAVALLGAALECVQYFVPGRYFGATDLMANALGVGLGAILGYWLLRRGFRPREPRPRVAVAVMD